MDKQELQKKVDEINWFHTMDLGQGIVTHGVDPSPKKLKQIKMPESLANKTVLDIGAWDGFFSFEAERRGAERVVAVDSFCWSGGGWGSKDGFELARTVSESRVEDREMEVMDLNPADPGQFDIVLFLGVLYHLRHPLAALDRVVEVTGEMLILETEVDLIGQSRPAMAFYQGEDLNRDPTNWWAPNPPALVSMLKVAGFKRVETVSPPKPAWWRWMRAWKQSARDSKSFWQEKNRDRMVVHAFKT